MSNFEYIYKKVLYTYKIARFNLGGAKNDRKCHFPPLSYEFLPKVGRFLNSSLTVRHAMVE